VVSGRVHHQRNLRDGRQKLLEAATRHLGTVHHLERATGGARVSLERFAGLENKGLTKPIQQPKSIRAAIDSNPAGAAQRTYPNAEWVHLRAPVEKAAKDSIPVCSTAHAFEVRTRPVDNYWQQEQVTHGARPTNAWHLEQRT
jgi:hypothetical protein